MLSDINVEAGEAMADKLRSAGHDASFLRADATVEEEVAALVSKTVEVFGGLHLAANIVGDAHPEAAGPEFHQQSLKGWEHTMAVSLRSVFLSMKHEIAHMTDPGGGAIAKVTSLAALQDAGVSGAAYAGASAGVRRLSKLAADPYAGSGV